MNENGYVYEQTQVCFIIMPGGNKYRQWYAVRKALQERGQWNPDTHLNTRQRTLDEVGIRVPPKKQPRLETDDEPPPLEGEEGDPDINNYAGKLIFISFILECRELDSVCY